MQGRVMVHERLEPRLHFNALPVQTWLPQRQTIAEPGEFLTGPSTASPVDAVRAFLTSRAGELKLNPTEIAQAAITDQYTDADTGVTHIYFRQTLLGLPIANAVMNINVARDGSVINLGGGFVPGASVRAPKLPLAMRTASQALRIAGQGVGLRARSNPRILSAISGLTRLEARELSVDPIPSRLQYVATEKGIELAWQFVLRTPDRKHWYDLAVGAYAGGLLAASDWVDDAAYNVFPLPVDAPNDGSRALLTNPHDPAASPFGWHDTNGGAGAEFTDTRGNNVSAQEDANANNTGGVRPSGGAGLNFDFALDLSQQPSAYQSAAITNLFYLNNTLHDIHYAYGFTEPAGNFQVNNYGHGGIGNDAVQADAQDGEGLNNANMYTPPDGSQPRMQMFVFDLTTPNRDGDFDNGIITHEYGHGVSNRLTGGPSNANALDALQSGGMGEGWSDWWGLMLEQRITDTQNAGYGIGTYVLGQSQSGGGIRRFPYSFNMSTNPLTLGDFNSSNEVHDAGEIWCSALWDMNWLLIGEHGFDVDVAHGYNAADPNRNGGNNLALKLVMDALKLQPANPTFLEARDAVLLADDVLTGGANHPLIWQAFARGGMGFSANAGANANSTVVVEAFDAPWPDPVVNSHSPGLSLDPVSFVDLFFNEPINAASFSVAADVVSFTGPGGVNLKPQIASHTFSNNNKTLRINFSPQAVEGDYSLVVGPQILATDNGNPMDQDHDSNPGEPGQDVYTAGFVVSSAVGPDGFGYKAYDIPPTGIALSPAGQGVEVVVDDVDDGVGIISLGSSSFNFYGSTYSTIFVSSNGLITFGSSYNGYSNEDLTGVPSQASIAPFWDDLVTYADSTDSVLYRLDDTGGSSAPDRIVIEWHQTPHYAGAGSETGTLRAILQLNTGAAAGKITFDYSDLTFGGAGIVDEGLSATVGIKNSGVQGTHRLLISRNALHPFVGTGKAILISTTPPGGAATVAGRKIFYNNSKFDGFNSLPGTADDSAIATNKSALLPGQVGTSSNYTSFSRGINGVMLDIATLPTAANPTASDFVFRVGNDNTPSGWLLAPTPTITTRRTAGSGGSDRITFTWPDGAITKKWLQVTALANSVTGLSTADVFYFGNAIGETLNTLSNALVTSTDYTRTRNNFRDLFNPAPIDFAYDFDRNGIVNTVDLAITRDHITTLSTGLKLINVPG